MLKRESGRRSPFQRHCFTPFGSHQCQVRTLQYGEEFGRTFQMNELSFRNLKPSRCRLPKQRGLFGKDTNALVSTELVAK